MRAQQAYPLALAGGVLLTLSFPEPDIAPLAWIALAPLFLALRDASPGRAALLGFSFGMAFFGTLLYWISIIGWIGWGVLVVIEALLFAIFAVMFSIASRGGRPWVRVLAAASLWVVFEVARSIVPAGGFMWGVLAQSQHNVGWILRLAAIGGGWAIGFVLAAVNASLAEAFVAFRQRTRTAATLVAAAAALVVLPLLLPANDATGASVRVGIVQGNVPLEIPEGYEREIAITSSHTRLTEDLADDDVDLVVWPESSLGLDVDDFEESQDALERSATAVDAPMVVGGNLDVGPDHYAVMAFHVSAEGEVVDRYQKTHLVPFGEYVPGRSLIGDLPILDQVPRDAVRGREVKVFDVAGGTVAPVISFEGDFGPLVRRRIHAGGRLLIVATNTSTWERSWASAQHVAFSQVRAAENGVWVAHAALSGISAFIAPDGTIVAETPLWETTSLVRDLRFAEDVTFYARYGDWLPALAALISVILLAMAYVRTKRHPG